MSRSLAAVLLVLLSACTGGSSSPHGTPEPGVAPVRFAAGVYNCPADHYVPVIGGKVYPAGYPSPPLGERPDRCFATEAAARAAGASTASPPPGFRVVAGQYLEPTPAAIAERCRRAASKAGFAVPCPGFIPASAIPQQFVGRGQFVMEIQGFLTPSDYPEDVPRHMFVMAAMPALARYVASCTGARPAGAMILHGIRARWITCPEGSEMNSGHVVIAWQRRGIDYAVSIHGNTPLTRKVCVAVARSVQLTR